MTPDDIPPRNSVPGCPAETTTSRPATFPEHDADGYMDPRRVIVHLRAELARERRRGDHAVAAAARGEAERDAERRSALAGEARLAELLDGYTELLRAFTDQKSYMGGPPTWTATISDAKFRRLARLVVELEPDNEEAAS